MSKVEREMVERIENYQNAKNNPTVSIGKKGHTAKPDFTPPEPKICKRYEQLAEEKNGCTIEHSEDPNRKGSVTVHINVEDEENSY
ncbi:MAG: hypothetical protein V3T23_09830 [Nitrososphaerales archaeon]